MTPGRRDLFRAPCIWNARRSFAALRQRIRCGGFQVRAWVIAALLLGAIWLEALAERRCDWSGLAEMPRNARGPESLRPSSRLVHLGCVTLSPIFAEKQ